MSNDNQKKVKLLATNKTAKFEYSFLAEYEAGIVLTGTEVVSIRNGKVNMTDCYCAFEHGQLVINNLYIAEYERGSYFNHKLRRSRILLLKRSELKKLEKRVKEKGLTIVPYQMYFSERGFVKVTIALAQGKKLYDKRDSIKEREEKVYMDRLNKIKL